MLDTSIRAGNKPKWLLIHKHNNHYYCQQINFFYSVGPDIQTILSQDFSLCHKHLSFIFTYKSPGFALYKVYTLKAPLKHSKDKDNLHFI